MMDLRFKYYTPDSKVIDLWVLDKMLELLQYVWIKRSSWSRDLDVTNKLSFPGPIDAPYVIWH